MQPAGLGNIILAAAHCGMRCPFKATTATKRDVAKPLRNERDHLIKDYRHCKDRGPIEIAAI